MNIAARAQVPLGDFMLSRSGSTDPSKHPNDPFVLYSIPAFDIGEPEFVRGSDIGSAKKNVESGDVLLSRIIPHIRRSWVVGEHSGEKILASGEWIVFRSDKIHARYLLHFLVSDIFHRQFMQTVTGVGGSLLRANPSHVSKITIPLPPFDEQRRIAAILDKADTLRRKRKRALTLLEKFTNTLIAELLDAPQHIDLGEIIEEGPTNGLYKPSKDYGEGVPILRINSFYDGKIIDLLSLRRLSVTDSELSRFKLTNDEIVINRVNSLEYLGKSAIVRGLPEPTVYESNMMRFSLKKSIMLPDVCIALLQTPEIKRQILAKAKNAVNQSSINQSDVRSLHLALPAVEIQQRFVARTERIAALVANASASALSLNILFSSLQSRAFSGQL